MESSLTKFQIVLPEKIYCAYQHIYGSSNQSIVVEINSALNSLGHRQPVDTDSCCVRPEKKGQ